MFENFGQCSANNFGSSYKFIETTAEKQGNVAKVDHENEEELQNIVRLRKIFRLLPIANCNPYESSKLILRRNGGSVEEIPFIPPFLLDQRAPFAYQMISLTRGSGCSMQCRRNNTGNLRRGSVYYSESRVPGKS